MSIELIAVIILGFVLAVVLAAYDRLLRELKGVKSEKEQMEEKARHKAMRILEQARDKAMNLLEKAEVDLQERRGQMDEQLQKATEMEMEDYKRVLQTVSKSIEEDAVREFDQFKRALESETLGAQKVVSKKIEEKYLQVENEIEEYKKSRLQLIDSQVREVIKEVVKRATGKTMSFEDHSDLVKQALEEAKKRNVL